MLAQVSREAVVIRFRPTDPASVLNWALKEHRRRVSASDPTTYYRLSVFADERAPDETVELVCRRLISAAELTGIDLSRNKSFWVTDAGSLADLGFTFWKDDDPDELREHYSVDLGTEATIERVERFLSAFQGPEETRSA